MKLTKAMRETMTEMMVEKYYPRANLDELRNALESFAKMQAFSSIPDSVLKTFNEYPGYFETSNDVRFAGTDGRFYGREGCIMVDFSGEHLPCPMSHFELPRNDTAVEMKKTNRRVRREDRLIKLEDPARTQFLLDIKAGRRGFS